MQPVHLVCIAGTTQQPGLARIQPASAHHQPPSRCPLVLRLLRLPAANRRTALAHRKQPKQPAEPHSHSFLSPERLPENRCQTSVPSAVAVIAAAACGQSACFSIAWSQSILAKPPSRQFANWCKRFCSALLATPHDPAIFSAEKKITEREGISDSQLIWSSFSFFPSSFSGW